jgi:predicted nucleic acid-binding protein
MDEIRERLSTNEDVLDKLLTEPLSLQSFARELERLSAGAPRRIDATPENLDKGLAQLVLTVIELLRQLMERQALRRMEAGSLSDEDIERLGQTFMLLARRMDELKSHFDIEDDDLNLNLGPLGDLL